MNCAYDQNKYVTVLPRDTWGHYRDRHGTWDMGLEKHGGEMPHASCCEGASGLNDEYRFKWVWFMLDGGYCT